jgi:hypothetical protein
VSEAALAPKMGPITEEERQAVLKWDGLLAEDTQLQDSIAEEETLWGITASYVLVRALRAGAKLEDLL